MADPWWVDWLVSLSQIHIRPKFGAPDPAYVAGAAMGAVLNGYFAVVVLRRSETTAQRNFGLMSACMAWWNAGMALYHVSGFQEVWRGSVWLAATWIPLATFRFGTSYLALRNRAVRIADSFLALFCSFLFGWALTFPLYAGSAFWHPVHNWLFICFAHPFLVATVVLFGWAALRTSDPLERARRWVIFGAGFLQTATGVLDNLQFVFPGLPVLGNVVSGIYGLAIGWAMLRFRLLDVRVALARAAGAVLVGAVAGGGLAALVVAGQKGILTGPLSLAFAGVLAAVATWALPRVMTGIQTRLEPFFTPDLARMREGSQQFNERLRTLTSMDEMFGALVDAVRTTFGVRGVAVYRRIHADGAYRALRSDEAFPRGIEPSLPDIAAVCEDFATPWTPAELPFESPVRRALESNGIGLVAGFRLEGKLVAVGMLRAREGGPPFSRAEIRFLSTLSVQAYHAGSAVLAFEDVRRLQTNQQAVLDGMGEGLLVVDPRDRVTIANPTARRMLGLRDVSRDRPLDVQEVSALRPLVPVLRDVRARGDVAATELRLGAGKTLVEVTARTVRDASGRATGVLLVLRDVSEVRGLREDAERRSRLEEIGRTLAQLSHELKNPLASLRGYADLVAAELVGRPDAQAARRFTEGMRTETARMQAIVLNFLDYSRPLQPAAERTDVAELLGRAVDEASRGAGAAAGISWRWDSRDPAIVFADPQMLEQVFANLLRNAVEAMPKGGTATCSVRSNAGTRGGEAQVEIADTGSGIPAADRAKLFRPFFTTKARGTGLGLAICRRIVDAHGGRIEVESRRGRGTVFRLALPLDGRRRLPVTLKAPPAGRRLKALPHR